MLAMVMPNTGARLIFLVFAVGGVFLLSKVQAQAGTAVLLLLMVGAVVLLLGDPAFADDGGISECGGINNWPGCDGTGELAGQATLGGAPARPVRSSGS